MDEGFNLKLQIPELRFLENLYLCSFKGNDNKMEVFCMRWQNVW